MISNELVVNNNYNWSDNNNNAPLGGNTGSAGTIDVSELSTDFEIKEPFTIPSDNKPYSIDIETYSLKASYRHYCVPKLDRDPFLLAEITDWEELNLITGPVNVYNGGKYIGRSWLDTRNLTDTLDISMGRDQKVLVSRVKKSEMNSKQSLGANRKVTYSYEINAKNNHESAIDLEVLEQVPVSKQKDIVVTVDEKSGAEYNELTGQIRWRSNIASGEGRKYKLTYTIKYPKARAIQMERSRKMAAPRYF